MLWVDINKQEYILEKIQKKMNDIGIRSPKSDGRQKVTTEVLCKYMMDSMRSDIGFDISKNKLYRIAPYIAKCLDCDCNEQKELLNDLKPTIAQKAIIYYVCGDLTGALALCKKINPDSDYIEAINNLQQKINSQRAR